MAVPVLNNTFSANKGFFGSNSNPLVSGSFSPAAGDLIVVKVQNRAANPASWTMSDSAHALTWTHQVSFTAAQGILNIFTAPVVTAPGSITVTATPSAACPGAMLVEWWSGAPVAASPATATAQGSTTAPSFTITTVKAGSVVSWCSNDANDLTGARTYITTSGSVPVEENFFNQGLSTYTHAYQTAATAGSQSVGETLPSPQLWAAAAIELQAAPVPGPTLIASYSPAQTSTR